MSDAPTAWVLHVDLDQFIAAVEILRRPELRGRPVIVGGRGDPTERAVVATASYEAREFGAASGMPLRVAARKVPDAVILPVDGPAYTEASDQVMQAVRGLSRVGQRVIVEVLGWDEAFLGAQADEPEALARRAQDAIFSATALHSSVGIGDTKVRAKIATGFGKPGGIFRLTSENWLEVMGERLTVALWGIGPRISKRLSGLGIETVSQLAAADPDTLVAEFGPRMGRWYAELGHGLGSATVDDTPWVPRGRSRETTYQHNLTTRAEVEAAVRELAGQVFEDTVVEGRPVFRVTLKVRYAPFFTQTKARKLPAPTHERAGVIDAAPALVDRLDLGREIRLLGVRAEMVMPEEADPVERTPIRGRI